MFFFGLLTGILTGIPVGFIARLAGQLLVFLFTGYDADWIGWTFGVAAFLCSIAFWISEIRKPRLSPLEKALEEERSYRNTMKSLAWAAFLHFKDKQ